MPRDPKPPNEFDLGLVAAARRSKPARSLAGGSAVSGCGAGTGGALSAAGVPSASFIDFAGGPGKVLGRAVDWAGFGLRSRKGVLGLRGRAAVDGGSGNGIVMDEVRRGRGGWASETEERFCRTRRE